MYEMTNKNYLYESIMRSISKEVKRALNENKDKNDPVVKAADTLCAELKAIHKPLDVAIGILKIIAGGDSETTNYNTSKFKNMKYKDVSYSELIPELESRL